jgi:hypothetical protein
MGYYAAAAVSVLLLLIILYMYHRRVVEDTGETMYVRRARPTAQARYRGGGHRNPTQVGHMDHLARVEATHHAGGGGTCASTTIDHRSGYHAGEEASYGDMLSELNTSAHLACEEAMCGGAHRDASGSYGHTASTLP